MIQEIWLVRHGETEWAITGQHTGWKDIPLTARGEEQARSLQPILAGIEFDTVLSSPLQRAFETCRLAGFADRARQVDDLREWNYGLYEGRNSADIRKTVPGWNIWTHGVEGGETAEQVADRAGRVIDQLSAANGRAIIFAHGHLLRILATRWLGIPPESGRYFALLPAAVSILGFEGETRVIRLWNRTPPGT